MTTTTTEQAAKLVLPTEKVHDNYRVVMDVEDPYRYRATTHEEWVRTGKAVVAQAERHLDGVDGVHLTYRTGTICKFCRREWEVDANGYPQCCTAATDWADANGITPELDEPIESQIEKLDADIERLEKRRDALQREKSAAAAKQFADGLADGVKAFVEGSQESA